MKLETFSLLAQNALKQAGQIAKIQNHKSIENGHLLKGILSVDRNVTPYILKKCGINIDYLEDQIDRIIASYIGLQAGKVSISSFVDKSLDKAYEYAQQLGDSFVSIEHILVGVLSSGDSVTTLLRNRGVTEKQLHDTIMRLRKGAAADRKSFTGSTAQFLINLTESAHKRILNPVVNRDIEIFKVLEILEKSNKNIPLLVGKQGTGKTSIVHGIAYKIADDNIADDYKEMSIYQPDYANLYANVVTPYDFFIRIQTALYELENIKSDCILFLDNIHWLLSNQALKFDVTSLLSDVILNRKLRIIASIAYESYLPLKQLFPHIFEHTTPIMVEAPNVESAIAMLHAQKEQLEAHHRVSISDDAIKTVVELSQLYLYNNALPGIGFDILDAASADIKIEMNTLPEEVEEIEAEINNLKATFTAIKSEENKAESDQINIRIAELNDRRQKIRAVWESGRELINDIMQGRADLEQYQRSIKRAEYEQDFDTVALLKFTKIRETREILQYLYGELSEKHTGNFIFKQAVDKQTVASNISKISGIHINKLLLSEHERLQTLDDELGKLIFEQKIAISAVSNAVRRKISGLSNNTLPLMLLFAGCQGSGKTELAKSLAEVLFGDHRFFFQFTISANMPASINDYTSDDCFNSLTLGELIAQPRPCVVMFDKCESIERHTFDEFRKLLSSNASDSNNLLINRCVFIFATEVANELLLRPYETQEKVDIQKLIRKSQLDYLTEIRKVIDKDLFKAIEDVILFNPLTYNEIRKIVERKIKFSKSLLATKKMQAEFSINAINWLTKISYYLPLGAQLIQKAIDRYILSDAAHIITTGEVDKEHIYLFDYNDCKIIVKKIKTEDFKITGNILPDKEIVVLLEDKEDLISIYSDILQPQKNKQGNSLKLKL